MLNSSESGATTPLRVGDWRVDPASGQISRNGESTRLESRSLRLLLCLAARGGEVVSIEELLTDAWAGVAVTPDSVYQAVASLRRVLGDDPKQPTYIATVPRLGYRMVAAVGPWADRSPSSAAGAAHRARVTPRAAWLAGAAVLGLVLAGLLAFRTFGGGTRAAAPQLSIAVLPFLDLTEGMKEEEFADGMTEELIDRLSRIPGLRVPAPTSSFYFKNKRVPVADIAKSLGVSYVLDGSVRKSGGRLRVAARLIRPENGYVLWSESYDRPWNDVLVIQDDIAGEVTKALAPSLSRPSKASG